MWKRFLRTGLLGLALAAGSLSAEPAPDPVVVTYPASGTFDEVLENVKWAITGRGLLVSGTLHVQEMLERCLKMSGLEIPPSSPRCSFRMLRSARRPAKTAAASEATHAVPTRPAALEDALPPDRERSGRDIYQCVLNLAAASSLYGGNAAALSETVLYSRYGVMPPWQSRLSESDIAAVAVYVHQLGGGE